MAKGTHTYLPTYLHTYVLIYLSTSLPTYLPTHSPTYLQPFHDLDYYITEPLKLLYLPTYLPTGLPRPRALCGGTLGATLCPPPSRLRQACPLLRPGKDRGGRIRYQLQHPPPLLERGDGCFYSGWTPL